MKFDKIVLLGSNGMLGMAWQALLSSENVNYIALTRHEVDICQPNTFHHIDSDASLVINCTAFNDVDGAESKCGQAFEVNARAINSLSDYCTSINAKFVHYSTNYVFDGKKDLSCGYHENEMINPLSIYGCSKALGEYILKTSSCDYLLIRTSWLYAPWGNSFLTKMVNFDKPSIKVVNDQYASPTSCEHLASCSYSLLNASKFGTWHVTDGGMVSKYEFAVAVANFMNSFYVVLPCASTEFTNSANRPHNGVLDISNMRKELNYISNWKTNLEKAIKQLSRVI